MPEWLGFIGTLLAAGVFFLCYRIFVHSEDSPARREERDLDERLELSRQAKRREARPPSIFLCTRCKGELLHGAEECGKCGKKISSWEDVETVRNPTNWRHLFQISEHTAEELKQVFKELWEPFVTATVIVWAVYYGQLWLAAVAAIYELYRVIAQPSLDVGEAATQPRWQVSVFFLFLWFMGFVIVKGGPCMANC